MYTETAVSQTSVNIYNNESSKLKESNTVLYTDTNNVYPESVKTQSSGDLFHKNEDSNFDLNTFNVAIRDRLYFLLSNASYKSLSNYIEWIDLESFKKFLTSANISYEKRNLLELSLLILIFLKNNEKESNHGDAEHNRDSVHKFDICAEIVNKIVNGNRLFYKNYDHELELLVNICIWSIEISKASNQIHLCYELLTQALRCGYESDLILSYIRNSILSKSSVISYISYTHLQYQHIYWNLRILQVAVSKSILNESDIRKVREFAINAIKLRNKSLYILDESACLLAQIWLIEGVDFNLDVENRLRVLVKLLNVSDSSFLINFRMDELTKVAILGPVESRKLALKCLFLSPEKVGTYVLVKNIERILYVNNFKRYRSLLNKLDLGILTIGVRHLKDLNGSVSYLSDLHNLVSNIIYGSNAGSTNGVKSVLLDGRNYNNVTISSEYQIVSASDRDVEYYTQESGVNRRSKSANKSNFNVKAVKSINMSKNYNRIHSDEYIVLLKILTSKPGGLCNGRCIKHKLNKIRRNLKLYYYPIFDLVNAIIATRSYISRVNSMAIKVDYVRDLSLYFLLGMDRNFTSIRRDYIKALTMSTNHIDFDYIDYVMDSIRATVSSNTVIAGSISTDDSRNFNGSVATNTNSKNTYAFSSITTKRNSWALKTLLSGLCEYLQVLFQFNVVDVYGANHQRVNRLCKEIICLFKCVIRDKTVTRDLSMVAQLVNVLKGLYEYNSSVLEPLVHVLSRISLVLDKYCFNIVTDCGNSGGIDDCDGLTQESGKFKENIDGHKGELLTSFCSLYEVLSCEKLPYTILESAVLAMVHRDCAGYVSRGLGNTLRFHSTKQLLHLVANQLILLQVGDWDGLVISELRRLVILVSAKIKRSHCRLVKRGHTHAFKFYCYNFRITQDSVEKKLKPLLDVHLVHLYPINELKLFESDYTLASDVVQSFSHDCPGE